MLFALICVPVVKAAERPNIVFIFADDWGWGDLSCHGHPYVKTPNIDRLAREGTDFYRFSVASGVCSPSRTAFLTGRYPLHTGFNHQVILQDVRAAIEHMATEGWCLLKGLIPKHIAALMLCAVQLLFGAFVDVICQHAMLKQNIPMLSAWHGRNKIWVAREVTQFMLATAMLLLTMHVVPNMFFCTGIDVCE